MRRSRQTALLAVIMAFMALTLAGCSIKIGWISNSSRSSMNARFHYFDGTQHKKVQLSAGDTILVEYDISLSKGSLTITLTGPEGEVTREEADKGDNSGRISFEAPAKGDYRVSLTGEDARGTYSVKWTIEKARG